MCLVEEEKKESTSKSSAQKNVTAECPGLSTSAALE